MSNSKYQGHTPGPWRAHIPKATTAFMDIPVFADSEIAFDLATVHNGGTVEFAANAALIAAAPDLLAENERLRAALSGTLTALRLARDSEPERWDALMGSRIGPEVATAWDKLNAALAGGEG